MSDIYYYPIYTRASKEVFREGLKVRHRGIIPNMGGYGIHLMLDLDSLIEKLSLLDKSRVYTILQVTLSEDTEIEEQEDYSVVFRDIAPSNLKVIRQFRL